MSEEIKEEKIRKVFLDELPRKDNRSRDCIDWNNSIGMNIYFEYEGIKDWIKIIDVKNIVKYNKNRCFLTIEYNNNIKAISSDDFKKCALGKILGKITSEFKIEVGSHFKDNKRDLIIISKSLLPNPYKEGLFIKNYKYHCNICGFDCGEHYNSISNMLNNELQITEVDLIKGKGCSCCNNKIVVEGTNDIPTTDMWMVKYFQGGYDEAKLYNKTSNKSIIPICPDCGRVSNKNIRIYSINKNHSISCLCSDGKPYPEKFMFGLLEQLEINFVQQLSKSELLWIQKYRYDFYIPSLNIIIETHGEQHYKNSFQRITKKTLEETQENDRVKKELAIKNGIKEENYIVIDCRKSELDFIKQNILNSRLSKLFDLSIIDWEKVEEFACSTLVRKVCEYWNSGTYSTKEITKIMKLSLSTVITYLKKGNGIWCNYDSNKEIKKNGFKNGKNNGKQVICLETKITFKSVRECAIQSEKIFGIKLNQSNISDVCLGRRSHHHNFHFKYITDLTVEEIIEYKLVS